jgi:hypothetical protein
VKISCRSHTRREPARVCAREAIVVFLAFLIVGWPEPSVGIVVDFCSTWRSVGGGCVKARQEIWERLRGEEGDCTLASAKNLNPGVVEHHRVLELAEGAAASCRQGYEWGRQDEELFGLDYRICIHGDREGGVARRKSPAGRDNWRNA